MKHLLHIVCVGMASLSLSVSCSRSTTNKGEGQSIDTTLVADSAVAFYHLQSQGKFADYTSKMHSCIGMSSDYVERIVLMLKQHQTYVQKNKQGVKCVEFIRLTSPRNAKNMVNVFLKVSYNDNSQEEVMFPMVYDNNRWWIQ